MTVEQVVLQRRVLNATEAQIFKEFNQVFQEQYGERWSTLIKALMQPTKHSYLLNAFSGFSLDAPQVPFLDIPCFVPDEIEQPERIDGLMNYYVLDAASVLAAELLEVKPGMRILDLCAAPGGKSLAIAQRLFAEAHEKSQLVCNELSNERRGRLKRVMRDYLPSDIFNSLPSKSRVILTGFDGSRFSSVSRMRQFDRVLVDVPCSSDRHVLHQMAFKDNWSKGKARKMADRQLSLLLDAYKMLKQGGKLVYSTCALSETENDVVIDRMIRKCKLSEDCIVKIESKIGERTKYGLMMLPDKSDGYGPLYICVLTKQ